MAVLDAGEVEELYDRRASTYDTLNGIFRTLGFRRHQKAVIEGLNLGDGDTVVDLCCGTGVNFAQLSQVVSPNGTVVGVDLSEGMLAQAKERARSASLTNVQLVQADVRDYGLPSDTSAVLSTFGLEMVPDYAAVIEKCAQGLGHGGRIGLLGLKHPDNWPDWIIEAGVAVTRPFGVSREYESFTPWVAADRYFEKRMFREHLTGAAYSYVGQRT